MTGRTSTKESLLQTFRRGDRWVRLAPLLWGCSPFARGQRLKGGLLCLEEVAFLIAITLTAIDLKAFEIFSMICYIGMGWAILPFMGLTHTALGSTGFCLLLAGGISFTIGAILYGIGAKVPWMHSLFHIFVVLGSILQFFCIYFYAI